MNSKKFILCLGMMVAVNSVVASESPGAMMAAYMQLMVGQGKTLLNLTDDERSAAIQAVQEQRQLPAYQGFMNDISDALLEMNRFADEGNGIDDVETMLLTRVMNQDRTSRLRALKCSKNITGLVQDFLERDEKCLSDENNSVDSCNKIMAMMGLLHASTMVGRFGSDAIAVMDKIEQNERDIRKKNAVTIGS